ncbi:MAG: drug:proton antiporter [Rhodobacteraceae bacterium]|nr:drug:proton antiporter [Paracoccaceae bacterium]
MSLAIAARIARRELRGGLKGFRIFLLCLALGVGAIAAVGMVRSAIERGLAGQGAVLLGGDAAMTFTYRMPAEEELAWAAARAVATSVIVDFRSMAAAGEERGLTQVKAVDDAYPLTGEVVLDPPVPLAAALAGGGGLPGGVMDRVLVDRMGLAVGDVFRLGRQEFRLMAALVAEPDGATGGFGLGPRTIVRTADLAASELLGPGTLYESRLRMLLPEGADLAALRAAALAEFRDAGMRWQDRRRGAPGVEHFVERIGSFLVLVGLAGLAVGGVGVSAAVRAYLEGKTGVIATLKTLGAESRTIFAVYFIQIGALTALGVAAGLALGAGLPLLLAPVIATALPVPVAFAVYPAPLAEAALYGVLTALVFTLWPLARTSEVRAAALFREAGGRARRWPRPVFVLATAGLVALLVGGATAFAAVPELALAAAVAIAAALAVLTAAAVAVRAAARRLARSRVARGRPALRLALAAVGGPREEAASVVLSLGLGLTVLAAVGQIEANLRGAIARDLPQRAPSYFFVDIQNDQLAGFRARLEGDPAVSAVETAPMLRGVVTRINGRPAREVAGDHWVLRGDRGVTYSEAPPPGARITAGAWWPSGYSGPPVMSFAADEGAELGLRLGDELTVNILGRDLSATITSFREVDFSTGGINFILSLNPGALAGAPHTHIATVDAAPEAEAAILRDLARAYPNITAIRVRDAIEQVTAALGALAAATAYAAAATLVTGFMVLIGAAAAGERARVFEAAVLKTLGATRARILASFALRSAIMGAAAGGVAIAGGGLAGWGVMTFVMETDYRFEPVSAVAIVAGGVLATMLAGLAFALRPLAARPAQVLRARE